MARACVPLTDRCGGAGVPRAGADGVLTPIGRERNSAGQRALAEGGQFAEQTDADRQRQRPSLFPYSCACGEISEAGADRERDDPDPYGPTAVPLPEHSVPAEQPYGGAAYGAQGEPDDGSGGDPADLGAAQLSDPRQRVDADATRTSGGTARSRALSGSPRKRLTTIATTATTTMAPSSKEFTASPRFSIAVLKQGSMSMLKRCMPKVVNPEVRRLAVTEAVFRVICRDGLEGATLRNIAEEAGLAIGSVRHYFTGHTDLTVFALAALRDRVTARILGHVERLLPADSADPTVDQRAEVEQLLAEFLPLDEQRRQEIVVWLEFVTAARTRPELQGHARELYDGMRMVVGRVLDRARRTGRLRDNLDIAVESERLSVLLDGLAMNAVLQPDRLPPNMIRRILAAHLDGLEEPS